MNEYLQVLNRLGAENDCPTIVMAPSEKDAKLSLRLRISSHAQSETPASSFDNPALLGHARSMAYRPV